MTDLPPEIIGKADRFAHNEEYTHLLLNDKFVRSSPGEVVEKKEKKRVAMTEQEIQERHQRVNEVDEACKAALEADSDFQDLVFAAKNLMTSKGEDVVAALKCVGVRGVALCGADVFKGNGVVLLTKCGERKNLRFAVEESAASFHGKESWTSRSKTVHAARCDYHAKHTQQLTVSTAYGVSIHGGVVSNFVEAADLTVSFSAEGDVGAKTGKSCLGSFLACCKSCCTCSCRSNDDVKTGSWDGSTDSKMPKDVEGYCKFMIGKAVPGAQYTFPGEQPIRGTENKMYQITKLHKLTFQYKGAGLQWQLCEIWANPADPVEKVLEFVMELGLLVTHEHIAGDGIPSLQAAKTDAGRGVVAQIMKCIPGLRAVGLKFGRQLVTSQHTSAAADTLAAKAFPGTDDAQ